mgnify:CR=1 FL=1
MSKSCVPKSRFTLLPSHYRQINLFEDHLKLTLAPEQILPPPSRIALLRYNLFILFRQTNRPDVSSLRKRLFQNQERHVVEQMLVVEFFVDDYFFDVAFLVGVALVLALGFPLAGANLEVFGVEPKT